MAATGSSTVVRRRERAETRQRVRPTARAAVLLVLVVALGAALVYPAKLYIEQRGELANLQRRTDALVKQNEQLTAEVKQLNDSAYLEQLARECLGMVKPGETAFLMVPKGGSPKPAAC